MENKIIVSAIGYNSVRGVGANKYWNRFEEGYHNDEALIIADVDPQKYLKGKGQKFLNKASLIYCNIAFQCIEHRNLQGFITENPDRVGLYDSSELSNIEACFQFDLIAKNEGPDYVSPMNAPNTIANAAASQMAIQAGVKGPNFSVCSGATGSLQALDIATMHLKQHITDFAIVGSTEVINKYQTAVRKGEKRSSVFDSGEQGAALLLERFSDEISIENKLAILKKFISGTQVYEESKEELIWRLISSILKDEKINEQIDLCVISGGGYLLDEIKLYEIFNQNNFHAPIAYPEKKAGSGDNAGGILGIIYAIGLFNGKIAGYASSKINHLLVISVDASGGASSVVVSNPTPVKS